MNEIQKYVANKTLATSDESFSRAAGGAMVKTSAVAGGVWLAAGLLPFVSFPFLLLTLLVVGGFLYIKD